MRKHRRRRHNAKLPIKSPSVAPLKTGRIKRALDWLKTPTGVLSSILAILVSAISLWNFVFVQTTPTVAAAREISDNGVLNFRIENPSTVFDMRDVVLGCQVRRVEVGEASEDRPVQFKTPIEHANGRILSKDKFFVITYRNPVNFKCGATSVFQITRGGEPYHPPQIELEIYVQYRTLWFQRKLARSNRFIATRSDGKYQWTEGAVISTDSLQRE